MIIMEKFAFIDTYNLNSSAIQVGFPYVNYDKLFDWLNNSLKCTQIYYYSGLENGDINVEEKHKRLALTGYNLRIKTIQIYKNNPKKVITKCPKCSEEFKGLIDMGYRRKANCDVELTFDMLSKLTDYDDVVFASGDGDFFEVIDHLAKEGKRVSLLAPSYKNSIRLSTKYKKLLSRGKVLFIDLNSVKHIIATSEQYWK